MHKDSVDGRFGLLLVLNFAFVALLLVDRWQDPRPLLRSYGISKSPITVSGFGRRRLQTSGGPAAAADAADVLRLVNGELIISTRVRIDGALAVGAGIAANGSATVRRDLSVHGRTLLGDDGIPVALSVMGQAQLDATTVTGPLTVQGTASLAEDLTVQGRTTLGSQTTAGAAGSTASLPALAVRGSAELEGCLRVGQNATVVQALAVDGPLTADGEATFSKGTRTLGTAAAAELAVSGRLSAPDVTAARLNVTALLTSLGSTSLGSGAGSALVVSGPATFNAEILAAGGATITDNLRVPSLAVDGAVSVGGNLTVARDTLLGTAPASVVIVSGTAQLAAATVLGALKAGAANLSSATVGGLETTALTARTVNVTGAAHLLGSLGLRGDVTLNGSLEVTSTLSVLNANGQDAPALHVLGDARFDSGDSTQDASGGAVGARSFTLIEPGRVATMQEFDHPEGSMRRKCYQGLRQQDLSTVVRGGEGLAALPCATTKTECSWAKGRNATAGCPVAPPTSTCCAVV